MGFKLGRRARRKRSSKLSNARTSKVRLTRTVKGLIPNTKRLTHRYLEFPVRIASLAAGASTEFNYSCNGLFDPNIQVGGHQPFGRDEMAVFYTRYKVLNSKITVKEFILEDANAGQAPCWGIFTSQSATGGVPQHDNDMVIDAEANMRAQWVQNGQFNAGFHDKNISWKISKSFSLKKYRKSSWRDHNPQDFMIKVGVNPNQTDEPQAFFVIYFQNKASSSATRFMDIMVRIEYDVVWSSPKALGPS